MRQSFLDILRCPGCREELSLESVQEKTDEIRAGVLRCATCSSEFEINDGIVRLGTESATRDEILASESALEERHGMSHEWLLSLPSPTSEFETTFEPKGGDKAATFEAIYETLDITGSERVLELAAGACWSTARFARNGCSATACDVTSRKYYGLRSADAFLEAGVPHFERVLTGFGRLPFRNECFDLVFIQSGFQYAENLTLAATEVFRVLAPGGRLVLAYTGVLGFLRKKTGPGHTLGKYLSSLRDAGLQPRLIFPPALEKHLDNDESRPRRYSALIRGASFFWRKLPLLSTLARRYGVAPATALFGIPVNLVARKIGRTE